MMNKLLTEEVSAQSIPIAANGKFSKKLKLIESDNFPFEELSKIAAQESHRKEVYRPVYHIHKWWAQRLGSIFRAVILGAALEENESLIKNFYSCKDLEGFKVFDPFMGSGTTVGEAHKLNCTALGRDINPVAFNNVKISLSKLNTDNLKHAFKILEKAVSKDIRELYKAVDEEGNRCDSLYYFWVKVLSCPQCDEEVPLFSSYIFSKHAYVKKHPKVQIYCPNCSNVFAGNYDSPSAECPDCKYLFDPHIGTVSKTVAHCKACKNEFPIAKTAKAKGIPPKHVMYAKMVLKLNGEKAYLKITDEDRSLYSKVSNKLKAHSHKLPKSKITEGYNTNQVINYGYSQWTEFFNDRQLYAILRLSEAINEIKDFESRQALLLLLSACLDFNNMFASFKGEGTGAVRHMFSHHILKPERMPLEANLWGTPKSSGSFSTLFKSRLLRAAEYQQNPFEISLSGGGKVYDLSKSFSQDVSLAWPPTDTTVPGIYISCGSSDKTKLSTGSIDVIVTDPPFFDNVHYSELADFFYAWSEPLFGIKSDSLTTRAAKEVQDVNAAEFAAKLRSVFEECKRVLVKNGLLIFSYHHSRKEGWFSVAQAVHAAGFNFIQAHPVKAEMSVATPKLQAKAPIDYDIILVCKKKDDDERGFLELNDCITSTIVSSTEKMNRLRKSGLALSKSDVDIIIRSELLKFLSPGRTTEQLLEDFITADTSPELRENRAIA